MIDNGNFIYNVSKRYGLAREEGSRLVRFFNESAVQGFLPALRDSEHYVRLLANLGYKFHVITSMTKDPSAQKLRTRNLQKLFGEDTFEKFIFLDTGEDKDGVLSEYEGTNHYWIEDKPTNAEVGLRFGLKSLVIEHAFNLHYEGDAPFVKNWKEIFETIKYGLKMSIKGVDDVPLFIFSPYPGTEIFEGLIQAGKINLNDDYFYSLTSLNGSYTSPGSVISHNPNINPWVLGLVRTIFILMNYGISYLFYPRRILRTLLSLFSNKQESATVFEHRLKDLFSRKKVASQPLENTNN